MTEIREARCPECGLGYTHSDGCSRSPKFKAAAAVQDAVDKIDDQVCPIDGSRMWQHAEYDEDEHRYEECDAAQHRWPLERIGRGEWAADADATEEKLEEYGGSA